MSNAPQRHGLFFPAPSARLPPSVRNRVVPTEVSIWQHFPRPGNVVRKIVSDTSALARIEIMRGIEVRNGYAVYAVRIVNVLTGITHFQQKFNPCLVGGGTGCISRHGAI